MRVFEKDGHRVTTSSPKEAVDHIARGYREVFDEAPGHARPASRPGAVVRRGEQVLRPEDARAFRDIPPDQPPGDERNNAPD